MAKFQPGQSGNPAGKPPGTLSESGHLRAAIREHIPAIITAMVKRAKKGDATAAKVLLERCLPALRASALPVDLPALRDAATLEARGDEVIKAVAEGTLTTDQASDLLSALGGMAKLKEVDDLARRVSALEAQRG